MKGHFRHGIIRVNNNEFNSFRECQIASYVNSCGDHYVKTFSISRNAEREDLKYPEYECTEA